MNMLVAVLGLLALQNQTFEVNLARMVCAQVYGNERGFYNAQFEYNRHASVPNLEQFQMPPKYVADAIKSSGNCPVPL